MTERTAHPRVLPLIRDRWSPRSFDGSDMPQEDLDVILEAAGWAPSAYNHQPWRFVYARRSDEANFARLLDGLVPFNASWAKEAGALVYLLSEEAMGDKRNRSHSFDAGAAWATMALQATALGYHAHAMVGLDFPRVREMLKVPEGYHVNAAVAIGRRAPAERLPEPLREREVPSTRKPLAEIAGAGEFNFA